MDNISIDLENPPLDFMDARQKAVKKAVEILPEPVIVAWRDDKTGQSAPEIPGGSPTRWHDYGENYGGQLELTVDKKYHFIFSDASAFTTPELALKNLTTDDGTEFLCLTDACTEQDRRKLGESSYYGGIGDEG